ncbi:hypothetical protein [Pseudomonas sp. ICMP 561]|nr:hypothetical protein [Pseudomonas sp. ICMP 561]
MLDTNTDSATQSMAHAADLLRCAAATAYTAIAAARCSCASMK